MNRRRVLAALGVLALAGMTAGAAAFQTTARKAPAACCAEPGCCEPACCDLSCCGPDCCADGCCVQGTAAKPAAAKSVESDSCCAGEPDSCAASS